MILNDFSALLQLSATLNAAFMVVDYAKGYDKLLANNVFRFPEVIEKSFEFTSNFENNKEILASIPPDCFKDEKLFDDIQELRMTGDDIHNKIASAKEELRQRTEAICRIKSFSALSCWMFLYCATLLYFCGFQDSALCTFIAGTLGIFSIIFVVIGLIVGEKHKSRLLNYDSLRHSIYWYLGLFTLTLILYFILSTKNIGFYKDMMTDQWIIRFIVILPFINFLIYYFKIRLKVKNVKQEIQNRTQAIKKEVDEFIDRVAHQNYNYKLVISRQEKEETK